MTETQTLHLTQPALTDPVDHGPLAANAQTLDDALRAAQEALGTKADAATVTALQTAVAGKADTTTVTALQTAVSGKADAAATTAALAAKADASALTPITAALAALGSVPDNCHNLLACYGEYTGTGTYGSAHPTTLTFPFYPVFVMVDSSVSGWSPLVGLRGGAHVTVMQSNLDTYGAIRLPATWTDRSASWYDYSEGYRQKNASNINYHYFALGYMNE